jgi:acetyl/propionyl-CoA carboxylase alpha subunit
MRSVDSKEELASAFERVSAEARSFFNDGAVYAEKRIERPRHIEVQVVGDARGKVIAVGERECSLQRRHQKVVEECPSPVVGPELRERLSAAAVAAARAVEYRSCGTVEFLLAPEGSFYFLEMNTRLQVEHPVTEEVWGVDLAAEMIRIALGEPLSIDLARLSPRGHAIECRIYAEDPKRGADRSTAIARLSRALSEYEVAGVETTLPLFRRLVSDPEFRDARFDVQWLDRRLADGLLTDPDATPEDAVLAAIALAQSSPPVVCGDTAGQSSLWRSAARRESLRGDSS